MLLAMTTWFSATAVLPQLRITWTLTTGQASFLTIAVQVGFVSVRWCPRSSISPNHPGPTLMLLGALGAAAVNLLFVWVHSPGPAIGLRFLTGASSPCTRRGSRRCPRGSGPAAASPWASWWGP